MEGFPLRHWSIRLFLLMQGDANKELDADIFDKVTYNLHPSFGDKAIQSEFCNPQIYFHSAVVVLVP